MAKLAFDGTVLEGLEQKYTVLKIEDINKYLDVFTANELAIELDRASSLIEHGREKEGKKPYNSYIVINTDEPYINEIIEIMKRHGHFE